MPLIGIDSLLACVHVDELYLGIDTGLRAVLGVGHLLQNKIITPLEMLHPDNQWLVRERVPPLLVQTYLLNSMKYLMKSIMKYLMKFLMKYLMKHLTKYLMNYLMKSLIEY